MTSNFFFFIILIIASSVCKGQKYDTPCVCKDGSTNCVCVEPFLCDANTLTIDTSGVGAKIDRIALSANLNRISTCVNTICCRLPTNERAILPPPLKCGQHNLNENENSISKVGTSEDNHDSAINRSQHPWLAAVTIKDSNNKYNFRTWGSIIHPQAILTATHNLKSLNGKILPEGPVNDEINIVTGVVAMDDLDNELLSSQQVIRVKELIFHTRYLPLNLSNDAALVILEKPLELNNFVNTICLPPREFRVTSEGVSTVEPAIDGRNCMIVGWDKSDHLKFIENQTVPLVDNERCQALMRNTVLGESFELHQSFICAGGEEGKGACNGYGGTPLVCNYAGDDTQAVQVGITSWGVVHCGIKDEPTAFVNVAMFVDWIVDKLESRMLNN